MVARVPNGIGKKQLNARPCAGLICSGSETKSTASAWPTPKKSPIGTSTE